VITVDPGQVLTVCDPYTKDWLALVDMFDRSSTISATASTKRKQTKYISEFSIFTMICTRVLKSKASSR
jgi:hypothetical protein